MLIEVIEMIIPFQMVCDLPKKKRVKMFKKNDSVIGAGTQIVGDITFCGSILIDGHVRGNITEIAQKRSTLILSERASVEGAIWVTHKVISGSLITSPAVMA
ncbi:MAG: polymer-forming cytoskeletal protein [Nitrosomonadaceae bacterium]